MSLYRKPKLDRAKQKQFLVSQPRMRREITLFKSVNSVSKVGRNQVSIHK